MRVLLVEDDDDLREAIALELEGAGYEVTSACDGAAALEMLGPNAGRLPELILLDLMMPNMDGQLFRFRQLADARLSAIPTLIMSGRPIDRATRSALGETPVLRKPFDANVLLAALLELGAPSRVSKLCGCGRRYDKKAWQELRFVGEVDKGRCAGERLELRLCACDSMLAFEAFDLDAAGPSPPAEAPLDGASSRRRPGLADVPDQMKPGKHS